MKLETFFEKFDQFADAPDAVTKMRELVLQLAVQGRLIHQDINDEPAEAMLQRFTSKAKSRRHGIDESEDIEEPFKIPRNWAWVRLTRVLNKLTDGTHHSPPNRPSGDFMYVTAKNIKTDGVELQDITYVSKEIHEEIFSRCDPSFGDVLYIKDGATTGVATINQLKKPFSMLSSVALLKPSPVILNRYLLWAMRSPFFYEETRGAMKGAAITRVTLSVMAASLLPIPPLAEQKRIVTKVEELMALCDRLVAQQKERETRNAALTRAAVARFDEAPTPANLNFLFHSSYSIAPAELRKTILNLAVQGKLVSQDPSDEAAATSLARLGLAKETGSLDEVVQKDEQIPESWSLVRFEDVAIVTGGVTLGRKLGDRKTVTLPYLRVANVKRGEIDVDIMKEVTIAEDEIERYALRENDLLMTEGGDWDKVGRAAIWNGEISPCLHQNHIFRARMRSAEIKPSWFERYFNSPQGRSYFESASKQTTNLASINMRQVRGCPVPFPPLAEQHRILARVDKLMNLVDKLDRQIAASESTARNLLDAVVHDLLHPNAGVVEFPRSESDRASVRAAIGCYAIEHLLRNPSFGHTMNMKVVYMAQAHIGLPLDLKFERQAAGPWHPWIEEFDTMGQIEGWFTVTQKSIGDGHTKYEYAPKAALKQKAAEAAAVLGEHRAEFDRLLSLFADMKTVDAEIVATLFAAWNDFLIDGKTPTDDEIIREVRTNWHESKKRFTPDKLAAWLKWMRKNRLVPQGCGPRTQQQLSLALN